MDWHEIWHSLRGHWKSLSPPSLLLAILGWLTRPRGRAWIRRWWDPRKALAACLGDLETVREDCRQDLEDCRQSRDGGRAAIEYANYALKEIVQSMEQVKAVAADPSTSSTGSPKRRSRSRTTSPASPRTRKRGPLDLPSGSQETDDR